MALFLTNLAVNTKLDAMTALLNSGSVKIYSGTRPATADTALSGNTLLATLALSATAFGASVAGVATANAITEDSTADATATATFYRAMKSDGTTVVIDGSVGTSGADLNLNAVAIVAGAAVQISSWTLTEPKS